MFDNFFLLTFFVLLIIGTDFIGIILRGDKVDICIDDGFHSVETSIKTYKSVMTYLDDEFIYFIVLLFLKK